MLGIFDKLKFLKTMNFKAPENSEDAEILAA